MQNIGKKLDESNDYYKDTAAQKPHLDHSDKKRTPKILGKIQAMINNNPRKTIRSRARDMEESEFLIRQVMPEYIQSFSYKMKKKSIFITKEKIALQRFSTNSSILIS